MTAERELALKYLPVFMLDEKEPFDMKAVGYTIFRSDLRSDSFPKRVIAAGWEKTSQLFRRLPVYAAGSRGQINKQGAGLQPGKHAVLSDPRLVRLVPQWQESCGELAGLDGVPLPEMFQDVMAVPDEAAQEMVHRYIRKNFSFEPSLRFVPFFPETSLPEKELLLPWPELKASVPKRLQKELWRIAEAEKSGRG